MCIVETKLNVNTKVVNYFLVTFFLIDLVYKYLQLSAFVPKSGH